MSHLIFVVHPRYVTNWKKRLIEGCFLARHQGEAVTVETIATNSLAESEKALDLVRGVISRENKVKDELRNLKKQ